MKNNVISLGSKELDYRRNILYCFMYISLPKTNIIFFIMIISRSLSVKEKEPKKKKWFVNEKSHNHSVYFKVHTGSAD